jgi:hypothetical protein
MDRGTALSWRETDRIIDQEVRRFRGTLPGYDADDLRQECRMAVAARIDPARVGARTYARTVAKDKLTNLLRASTTLGRCPHDPWGRPLATLEGLDVVMHAAAPGDAEGRASDREAVSLLRERLDPRDWAQLVAVAVEGAQITRAEDQLDLALVRQKAASILRRIGYRVRGESEVAMSVSVPEPDPNNIPDCHPQGPKPIGYDPGESECVNCRDKFTCLPRSIDGGLVQLTRKADLEVDAVLEGRIGFMDAIGRMKRRLARAKAKEKILPEELPTWDGLAGAAEPADDAGEELEHVESDDTPEEGTQSAGTETNEGDRTEKTNAGPPAPPAAEESDMGKGTKGKKTKPKKTTPKAPAAAKPPAQPKAPPAPKASPSPPAEPQPVVKNGVVKLGAIKLGTVKKTRNGWGWYGVGGKDESSAWLGSEAQAVAGLVRWAHSSKGPLAKPETPAEKPKAETKTGAKAPAGKAAKPPKAAKAKPAEKAAAEPERPKSWPTMANTKPLPSPRVLTEEEMTESLAEAQSKLGANIQLEYGMEIARRKREGDIVVAITPKGWRFEVDEKDAKAAGFSTRTQFFGSLSSVAMWAEKRMVSGNDFFNLSKHNCTEVRDTQGRIIDRKGGVAIRK